MTTNAEQVLRVLKEHGPMTSCEIAELLNWRVFNLVDCHKAANALNRLKRDGKAEFFAKDHRFFWKVTE